MTSRPAPRNRAQPRGAVLTAKDIRVLRNNPWFAALTPELERELQRRCVVRRYAANSLVYLAASPPSGFYLILEGQVGLEHVSRSGKFAFYHTHGPGEMFGMLSEIDGSPRFSDARALGETMVAHVSHAHSQEMMREVSGARDAFVRFICENLHTMLNMLAEHHSAPPREQMASILVSIFSRPPEASLGPPKLTHETLAAMAGISRQTASKVLHAFRDEGLIEMQYGKVRARNLAGLLGVARSHAA